MGWSPSSLSDLAARSDPAGSGPAESVLTAGPRPQSSITKRLVGASGSQMPDLLLQCPALPADLPKVILRLLIHPTLRSGVEGDGKADGHLRADASATIENLGKRFAAHS